MEFSSSGVLVRLIQAPNTNFAGRPATCAATRAMGRRSMEHGKLKEQAKRR
jgi:hypothetical protein